MTRRRTWAWLGLGVALVTGCSYSPAPPPASETAVRTSIPSGVEAPTKVIHIPASGEGWNIQLDSVRAERILIQESENEAAPEGRLFLVVDLLFFDLEPGPGETQVSTKDRVMVEAEDGTVYEAVGAGSDGSYCRCEFSFSSGENLIEFGYVFVIPQGATGQRFELRYQDTPPLRFAVR
jgi:hypothetical protein